jgi:hypothetical protein
MATLYRMSLFFQVISVAIFSSSSNVYFGAGEHFVKYHLLVKNSAGEDFRNIYW